MKGLLECFFLYLASDIINHFESIFWILQGFLDGLLPLICKLTLKMPTKVYRAMFKQNASAQDNFTDFFNYFIEKDIKD